MFIPMDIIITVLGMTAFCLLMAWDCRNLEVRTKNKIRRERAAAEREGGRYE